MAWETITILATKTISMAMPVTKTKMMMITRIMTITTKRTMTMTTGSPTVSLCLPRILDDDADIYDKRKGGPGPVNVTIPSALLDTYWEHKICTAGQRVMLTITGPGPSFYHANSKQGSGPKVDDVL